MSHFDQRNHRLARRRWRPSLFGALVAALMLVGQFYWHAPGHSFRDALGALRNDRLERVAYDQIALRHAPGYYPHACLLEGALAFKSGKYGEAVERLEFALDHPETRALGLTFGGEAQLRLGHLQLGESALLAALKEDRNSIDARRWLAAAYFDTGAYPSALNQISEWEELAPQDPRPYWLAGRAYDKLGQTAEAIKAFRRSLALAGELSAGDPPVVDLDGVRYELASAEASLDDYQAALADLESAGEDSDVLALRARCYWKIGDDAAARTSAKCALQLVPQHASAGLLLAQVDLETGRVGAAVDRLRKLIEIYPSIGQFRTELAKALRRQNNDADAEQEEALAADLAEKRREIRGLTAKAGAVPADPGLRLRMARRAAELGMFDEAQLWIRYVLAIDPTNEEATELLPRLSECTLDSLTAKTHS